VAGGRPAHRSRLRTLPSRLRCESAVAPASARPFFFAAGFPAAGAVCVPAVDASQATHAFCSSASHCTKPHRAAIRPRPRPKQAGGVACGPPKSNQPANSAKFPACRAWVSRRWTPAVSVRPASTCFAHLEKWCPAAAATRGWWGDADTGVAGQGAATAHAIAPLTRPLTPASIHRRAR